MLSEKGRPLLSTHSSLGQRVLVSRRREGRPYCHDVAATGVDSSRFQRTPADALKLRSWRLVKAVCQKSHAITKLENRVNRVRLPRLHQLTCSYRATTWRLSRLLADAPTARPTGARRAWSTGESGHRNLGQNLGLHSGLSLVGRAACAAHRCGHQQGGCRPW